MFKKTTALALMVISANPIEIQANDVASCMRSIEGGTAFDYMREKQNCESCGRPLSCDPPSGGDGGSGGLTPKQAALWKKY